MRSLCLVKCLTDVSKDVISIFNADTESHEIGTDAGSFELLVAELPVCRARRMQDTGPSIGDMNDDAGELERVHESAGCLSAACHPEGNDAAGESVSEITL